MAIESVETLYYACIKANARRIIIQSRSQFGRYWPQYPIGYEVRRADVCATIVLAPTRLPVAH